MKTMILGLVLLGFVATATAVEKKQLDDRIHMLAAKFEMMQAKPGKSIPAEYLQQAQGVILLDRTKAGAGFGYQGGGGVALVRDPITQQWGPAAFVDADEASLGFQLGAEQNFIVILLMDTNATRLLTEPNFEFAGEARGTAGNASATEGSKVSLPTRSVLVFDDSQGLYGGATVKGGAVKPDDEANRAYYKEFVTMRDVLFDQKVKPSEATSDLDARLAEHSQAVNK